MYNANKSIFPAYAGLEDIKVELPAPPSKSSIARDVGDLWKIHTSEPYVTALHDPGLKSPLPDEGFNPEKDLSETSEQNLLVNRGSKKLSQQEYQQLMSDLKVQYIRCLDKYNYYNSMNVGEIKDAILEESPGAFLIYNSSNKKLLIQAKCILDSLEHIVEDFVQNATFENDAKSKMISFVSLTPQTKDALLLPDLKIRQKLKGNTEVFDHITNTLNMYGLSSLNVDMRENDGFDDHRSAINISRLDLDLEANTLIARGFVKNALLNSLKDVFFVVKNSEIKTVLKGVILNTIQRAEHDRVKNAASLVKILKSLQDDLKSAGIDPIHSRKLMSKVQSLKHIVANQKNIKHSNKVANQNMRSERDLKKATLLIHRLKNRVESEVQRSANDDLPLVVKMYAFLTFENCLQDLAVGKLSISSCSEDLYNTLKDDIQNSNLPSIKVLKAELLNQSKDFKNAQSSQNQINLEKAKEDSLLSSKKFEVLSGLMG